MQKKYKLAHVGAGIVLVGSCLFLGCDEVACPLNNTIYATYAFYAQNEDKMLQSVKVLDTLTITAAGTDSILINRETGASKLQLPLSYKNKTDTLVFTFTNAAGIKRQDSVWIHKQSYEFFESPDCPTVMFHKITGLRSTHQMIDSIYTENPNIDYNATENFKIVLYADI